MKALKTKVMRALGLRTATQSKRYLWKLYNNI